MTNHFEVNMDEYLPLRDVVFMKKGGCRIAAGKQISLVVGL